MRSAFLIWHNTSKNGAIENIENSKIEELLVTNTIPMCEEKRKQIKKIKILDVSLMIEMKN